MTTAHGICALTQLLRNDPLEARLPAVAQAVRAAAVAVRAGEMFGLAPDTVTEGRRDHRAGRPDRLEQCVYHRVGATVDWSQGAERAVHHYCIARLQAQRCEIGGQLFPGDH